MFGNNKPFGTASTFGASTFGSTTTPFGQNTTAFGAKPATSNVFGTSAFGVAQPNTGSLFGSTTPAAGTGLFGQPSTAFGAPASTSTGSFGFGATSTSGGLFGSATPSTQSSGLFGSNTSAFGTPRPAFGGFGASTPGTGLFGQSTSTGTSLFGSSGGFSVPVATGTTVKFNPPTGTDTMMKGGVSTSIGTRHQCITCMKEYENKSLEELRVEDYAANRKGSSATGMGFGNSAQQTGGLFGSSTAASTSAFSFGNTTQAKPLFGTTGGTNTFGSGSLFGQPAQNQNTGLFGKSVGFGAPTTSAAPVFNFGASTGTSLFGQNNQQKPLFGQPTACTGLFGNTATTQATGFGTTTGFGGFGATNQQSTGLFGAKPTGFGATNTTTTNTFSFGNTNNMSGGGLFGQKPAAPAFGTPGFGAQTSGFGSFGNTQTAGTGLFGPPKPATSVFVGTGGAFGSGLGSSFGNPSFSMGLGTNTGTGLFGASNANKGTGFSFVNPGTTGFNFGAPNTNATSFNFNPSSSLLSGCDPCSAAISQQAQQQLLAMAVNPFGDSPLFRNPIKDVTRESEVLKPTNPSAQKALLNDNHYKVALLPTAKIKPKPWSPAPTGKVFLFDGLEDEEPSLGNAAFLPKRSVKKLVLKNIGSSRSTLTLTSNFTGSSSQHTRLNVSISLRKPDKTSNCNSGDISSSSVPLTVDINESNVNNNTGAEALASSVASNSIVRKSLEASLNTSDIQNRNNSINDSFNTLYTNTQNAPSRSCVIRSDSENDGRERELSTEASSSNSLQQGNVSVNDKARAVGIILTKPGYYTLPSMEDIISLIDENGDCIVEDFTIGEDGKGHVMFPGKLNLAGLNLDEIVEFNKKEINIYPDDEKKPPIGEGLNRKAIVTLENVWPDDKTDHFPITDPDRLSRMGFVDKIRNCTIQLGATYIDYEPETGSWIFQVDHFSKYGLEDSDEEMDVSQQPDNKSKAVNSSNQVEKLNGHLTLTDIVQKQLLTRKPIVSFPSVDEEMEAVSSQLHLQQSSVPVESDVDLEASDFMTEIYSPTRPILNSDIDAERIQGMKVSFFQEEADELNWGPPVCELQSESSISKRTELGGKQNHIAFKPKKSDKISGDVSKRQRHFDYEDNQLKKYGEIGIQNSMSSLSISAAKQTQWLSALPIVKSVSQEPVLQKAVPIALNKICLKAFKNSVLWNKQHLIADAGYFMGRRFRVGWCADGTIVHLEPPNDSNNTFETLPKFLLFDDKKSYNSSHKGSGFSISLDKLAVGSSKNNERIIQQKNLIDALELQLKNSVSTFENDSPFFLPKPGVELLHIHAKLFENQLKDIDPLNSEASFVMQCSYVWSLLVSLWGNVKGLEVNQTVSKYTCQMARREALSEWLIKTTESSVTKEAASWHQRDGYLLKIFFYLNGRRTADAVKLALQNHDYRLSLLLSQAEGSMVVRKLIGSQLLNWEQNGAYKFIKYNRIVIYALLAGMMIWENAYETLNCCKNLNWKQTLALHLWYHCSPNASIQDAVEEYDKSFQGTETRDKYSLPPYAPYVDILNIMEAKSNSDEAMTDIYDTCYHILKLYCDRTHRFDQLLMPETYSPDHLDYRLSWLLHLALSSVGYNISTDLACTLHLNFASELEAMGLWQWAVFVLLHHPDGKLRIKHVKDILLRHVSLDQSQETEEKENFLKNYLLIPEKWIFEAKAIKSRSMGKHAEEAWFLLKAGSWSKSHSIVVKYLASDAIINEDYDYLMKYLAELAMPERSSTILDWSSGGQVYLDYINMCQMVQGILSRETSAYDLEKFTPEVVSLCNRLSSVPAHTLKDRLSIAEMAKKTATTLRSIAILQAERTKNNSSLTMLTSYLKNLPMPHDYAMSENRFVVHCFLKEVTSGK